MSNSSLEQYLLARQVDIREHVSSETITKDDAILGAVAGAWDSNKDEIRLVIRARIENLREDLVMRCLPQETVVLRQAMVELLGVLEDFEKYHAEFKLRDDTTKAQAQAKTTGGTTVSR